MVMADFFVCSDFNVVHPSHLLSASTSLFLLSHCVVKIL